MMLLLEVLLLICILTNEAFASASCEQNGQLTVFKKSVQRKGYQFEKTEVNRTIPVEVIYKVLTNDNKVTSVSWKHNNKELNVNEDTSSEFYYTVEQEASSLKVSLHIGVPNARVTGEWIMTMITGDGNTHSAMCMIGAPPILHLNIAAFRANEGASLSIPCQIESFPQSVVVEWKRYVDSGDGHQLVPVDNANFKDKDGVKNAIIEWQNASAVGGFYLCTASSPHGYDNALIEIRIKNLGTYLWPSIGIILELVVLIITIIVYERSQSKKRKAEAERSLDDTGK